MGDERRDATHSVVLPPEFKSPPLLSRRPRIPLLPQGRRLATETLLSILPSLSPFCYSGIDPGF